MEKNQVIFFVCFASLLLILLLGFLLFILLFQRRKSNRFIKEREALKVEFNEQLLKSQLEMQEQTFNTISMEIHDNVGQTLSLLKVQLNIIDHKEVYDKQLLGQAKENVTLIMTGLRDIAKSLSSERLRVSTLAEMIAHEADRVNQLGILNINLRCEGTEKNVTEEKKVIVFRMIQESFQNIVKHSMASAVQISLIYRQDELQIEINDNGKGFNSELAATTRSSGMGLQNILKRATLIGGKARIESAANKGTTITIITPYA